jgi:hypothetical protein
VATTKAKKRSKEMRLYLRLLLDGVETYSDAEQAALRECLTTTPGITLVKRIERHPRGGYAVFIERTGDLVLTLEHLTTRGYRHVL